MSTTFPAPVPRQTAVLAAIAALHVGAFILVSTGLRIPPALIVEGGPWVFLPPPEAPDPRPTATPDPTEVVGYDPKPVDLPPMYIPEFPVEPAERPDGQGDGSRDGGAGAVRPAADDRGPSVRTRDLRLQALIDACYPSAARRRGQEGRGVARIVVDAAGRASAWHVEQSTGFAELDPGMGCVAQRVQFEPGRRDGRAVEATVFMPIHFRLH